jgi:hypothetical protein
MFHQFLKGSLSLQNLSLYYNQMKSSGEIGITTTDVSHRFEFHMAFPIKFFTIQYVLNRQGQGRILKVLKRMLSAMN